MHPRTILMLLNLPIKLWVRHLFGEEEEGTLVTANNNSPCLAVALKDDAFWFYRQKSLIHEALGELKMAIDAAQRSLELAESAGNQQYVNFNKKKLREWTEK